MLARLVVRQINHLGQYHPVAFAVIVLTETHAIHTNAIATPVETPLRSPWQRHVVF